VPVAELNELVVAALKRAMRVKGVEGNASAFTRLLRTHVGDGPDPTTVGRWLKGEQTVPAWALVAASQVSDISPTDLLLPEADVTDVKRLVEDLEARMAELRTSLTTAERRGGNQAAPVSDARLAQLADVVARLQDAVETQGELLDRVAKQILPRQSRARADEAATPTPTDSGGPGA
jgi:hypothetical protein